MKRFEGKGAVVTGAGRGIGRATAECFAAEGAGVVLFGWHADVLEDIAAGIREKGGRCEVVVGDVSQAGGHPAGRRRPARRRSAGTTTWSPTPASPTSCRSSRAPTSRGTSRSGSTSRAPGWPSRSRARQMVKEGHGGAMVVVSSTNAYQPEQEGVFYNTSKSGQVAVMHTAAMELGKYGIRVNGIAPGIINTRLSWFVIKDPVQSKVFLDRTPMGRFAEPVEMARPILFMCSEDASFMSGALMVVDGAYSVGLPVPGVLDAPLVPGGVR